VLVLSFPLFFAGRLRIFAFSPEFPFVARSIRRVTPKSLLPGATALFELRLA
jgi:hypothetical protein